MDATMPGSLVTPVVEHVLFLGSVHRRRRGPPGSWTADAGQPRQCDIAVVLTTAMSHRGGCLHSLGRSCPSRGMAFVVWVTPRKSRKDDGHEPELRIPAVPGRADPDSSRGPGGRRAARPLGGGFPARPPEPGPPEPGTPGAGTRDHGHAREPNGPHDRDPAVSGRVRAGQVPRGTGAPADRKAGGSPPPCRVRLEPLM